MPLSEQSSRCSLPIWAPVGLIASVTPVLSIRTPSWEREEEQSKGVESTGHWHQGLKKWLLSHLWNVESSTIQKSDWSGTLRVGTCSGDLSVLIWCCTWSTWNSAAPSDGHQLTCVVCLLVRKTPDSRPSVSSLYNSPLIWNEQQINTGRTEYKSKFMELIKYFQRKLCFCHMVEE